MSSPFSKIKFEIHPEKSALITGGSSGIGLEIARILVSNGMDIWIIGREREKLDKAIDSLERSRKSNDQIIRSKSADVSNLEQINEAIDQIKAETNVPDLLINSAGVVKPGYVQDLELSDFRWMIETNYMGTVFCTKALLPDMIDRGAGYIVNISSFFGYISFFGYTAYAASKYAVRGFTDALRSELKPRGIGVSIVFPADTNTPQLEYENAHKPQEMKYITGVAVTKEPEEIAFQILHGIQKGRYQILPKGDSYLYYKLTKFVGAGIYPIVDYLVFKAFRKVQNTK